VGGRGNWSDGVGTIVSGCTWDQPYTTGLRGVGEDSIYPGPAKGEKKKNRWGIIVEPRGGKETLGQNTRYLVCGR